MMNNSSYFRDFMIDVLSPREAMMHMITEASMPLIEYLTYVSSCVSTWFGISILSLTPAGFLTRVGDRNRKKRSPAGIERRTR